MHAKCCMCVSSLMNGLVCLCRWRLVVHGGVDGYSRLITYLKCSNNKRSDTVLHAFQEGIQTCGMPQRIRSDRGGENVQVCTYILTHALSVEVLNT